MTPIPLLLRLVLHPKHNAEEDQQILLRESYDRQKERVFSAVFYCIIGLGLAAFAIYEAFIYG